MYLLKNIRLTLINQIIKLFLPAELVNLKLPFEFLLLLDFILGRLDISLQVNEEVWLLDHLQTLLQLGVLFCKVDNGLVSVL